MSDWKTLGKEKAASVNALIPKSWLLTTPLPSVKQQRDVTGKYIQQFLSRGEIEITETDAVGIVQRHREHGRLEKSPRHFAIGLR
jgi:amidase